MVNASTTADFKNGLVLKFNNDFYTIVEFQHVKPGKGGAFVRTKLKCLTNGRILENKFNAGVRVEFARIERRKFKFMYSDGDDYYFMNVSDYDQIAINKEMIPNVLYLNDHDIVTILINSDDDSVIGVELPLKVQMLITDTEPGERGNTATNPLKRATTETGLKVMVPLFIEEGDVVEINTSTGEYTERIQKCVSK